MGAAAELDDVAGVGDGVGAQRRGVDHLERAGVGHGDAVDGGAVLQLHRVVDLNDARAGARRLVFVGDRPPPSSTLFPYTTLFRSDGDAAAVELGGAVDRAVAGNVDRA